MDLIARTDLEELARRDREGVQVSIFQPTHRFGRDVEADRIRWKNTLVAVDGVLTARGLRRPEIDDLLKPAWELQRDSLTWQYMSDGLAMFLHPGGHEMFRVPIELPEVTTVGDRFVVGPLLPILSADQHFLLLAVSQSKVRLLEGSRYRVEEVNLREVPTSLRDVVTPPEPRSDTMAYATTPAGRGGPANFYGYGAADEDFKSDEIERFLRQVAHGLGDYLASQELPMVLLGLDALVSAYREVNLYPHVLDEAVRRNPDRLTAEELHAAAWPVVEGPLRGDQRRALERFNDLDGTGRASADLDEIEVAAVNGRVESLLLPADPSCWARAATASPTVLELGADSDFATCELLDRAAVDTLVRGGQLYFSESPLPGGRDVAAVFRY